MVGIARFELATFCPPDKRANQAALRPDGEYVGFSGTAPNIASVVWISRWWGKNLEKSCGAYLRGSVFRLH